MITIRDYDEDGECTTVTTISYMYYDDCILFNEDAGSVPDKDDRILIDDQEYAIHKSIYNPIQGSWYLILQKA